MMANDSAAGAYGILMDEDDARVCADISEAECRHQPRNFLLHVLSLGAARAADGLVDPKLVLAWLMTQVGAPAALAGLLVPVREAGLLLPQLLVAGTVRGFSRRKWVWVAGSVVQGLAALGIAASALLLWGSAAGWTILGLLAVLAVARSFCSVSLKDVLVKTVDKARRGTATGVGARIGSAAAIVFALSLIFEWGPRGALVIWALMLAGMLWILAACIYAAMKEEAGVRGSGPSALRTARENVGMLRSDGPLRRFILARALLVPTALAPPYMVALVSATPGRGLQALGSLILASTLAGFSSVYIWGRLADRSSRRALVWAGGVAAAALALTAVADAAGWLMSPVVLPLLVFAVMLAYHGARLGRSTHLVDMATADTQAAYTALTTTVIGLLLFSGGAFAFLAAVAGPRVVVGALAALCALSVPAALRLDEV